MNKIEEIINNSVYIYSNNTVWDLKRYKYHVCGWEAMDMPDECFVICTLIAESEDGHIESMILGEMLGFAMRNQIEDDKTLVYKDKSEVNLFFDILDLVKQKRLIRQDGKYWELTELGKIALEENKVFKFYKGDVEVYEHEKLLTSDNEPYKLFPFREDLGLTASLNIKFPMWPNDNEVYNIIYREKDETLEYLTNQIGKPDVHLYSAELLELYEKDKKYVKVSLYNQDGVHIPIIHGGENIAPLTTSLLNAKANQWIKDYIVLECLFQKLWNDTNAIMIYETLCPYKQFINFEKLTIDNRLDWRDELVFDFIVEEATADCWENISKHCDIDIIKDRLNAHLNDWSWDVLSQRIDDDFLRVHFLDYPWCVETISDDDNRSIEVIQELILLDDTNTDLWLWDKLEKRLEADFIWEHLDVVNVNLKKFTEDTEKCRKAITTYPEKQWDWENIEKQFDLDFIVSSIGSFLPYLKFEPLFDRMFSKAGTDKYLTNDFYHTIIEQKDTYALARLNLNQKAYCWSIKNISFLAKANLITWKSTPLVWGFEYNPNVNWSKPIFAEFHKNIESEDGYNTVSSSIADISLLIEYPDFAWNWDYISSNDNLIYQEELYIHFKDKINWAILLRNINDVSIIESINDIDRCLGDKSSAWTAFSEVVTVPTYIQQHRDYPWDWTVLTERMFPSLRLSGLSHPLYINKWNWTYLSENLECDFILANLNRFCDYWDWEEVCRRIVGNNAQKLQIGYLDSIVVSINAIEDSEKRLDAWHKLTSSYSFKELKHLIVRTKEDEKYAWSMSYICEQEEFRIPEDLIELKDFIDWDSLSSSKYVATQFGYNKSRGLTQKAWWERIREYLSSPDYHWNFYQLSHFECLNSQQWFLSKYAKEIDWDYVSANSQYFAVADKQKFNECLQKFKDYINLPVLASRDDIDTEQLIKIFPNTEYDYNKLMMLGKWNATEESILKLSGYPWDWELVSQCSTFKPSEKFLMDNLDKPFDWWTLSSNELEAWRSTRLITQIVGLPHIKEAIDWSEVSSKNQFPLSEYILKNLHDEKLNWKKISQRKEIASLLHTCADKVVWNIVSHEKWFINEDDSALIERLRTYKEYLDWSWITEKCSNILQKYLVEFEEYIDWNILSRKNLGFNKELIDQFKERWNWVALTKNPAYYNKQELVGFEPASKIKINEFIERFAPRKPRAYHFAHMSNAIRIINEMYLSSRNAAKGKFEESAGSNVHRTNKAHNYARFYFLPKSPTQFHNECLGKDRTMAYYDNNRRLGLPKCPLPVFFVIDIEELLSVMPNKCYYSNGNMQADATRLYKVIDDPRRLNISGLYEKNNTSARQQEFLVKEGVELNRLSSLRICCYDEIQKQLLLEAIKDSRFADRIEVDESLYCRYNKELTYDIRQNSVSITSNLEDDYCYSLVCEGEVPKILNTDDIISDKGDVIRFKKNISVELNQAFEIYFEMPDKKWLIYKND